MSGEGSSLGPDASAGYSSKICKGFLIERRECTHVVVQMRSLLLLLLLPVAASASVDPINAIAGDRAFIERHGRAPNEADDTHEEQRIVTHLEWILHELRNTPAPDPSLQARRTQSLDALERYIAQRRFPRNMAYPGRRPRFADEDRWCAVGALIVADGQQALARSIGDRFEYSYLSDMHDPALDAWIARSGFTARELATIQPSYGWEHPEPDPIPDPIPVPRREPRFLSDIGNALDRAESRFDVCFANEATPIDLEVRETASGEVTVRARTAPRRRVVERCAERIVRTVLSRAQLTRPPRPIRVLRKWMPVVTGLDNERLVPEG
jgi:hypothetical protein